MPLKTEPYDVVDTLDNAESIFHYLSASLEDSDAFHVAGALDDAIRAKGFAQLSKETGIPYSDLVRTMNTDNRCKIEGLLKITQALGIKAPEKAAA